MQKMKRQMQDSDVFAPDAQCDIVTGEVKAEITFFWPDVDEWTPRGEAREFMEDTKSPHLSDLKDTNPREQMTYE
jgi:hypothetical protein